MIEKVGHSKRMALMRKEWIDEGKPGYARDKALRQQDEEGPERLGGNENAEAGKSSEGEREEGNTMFFADLKNDQNHADGAQPEDDELDALLREQDAESAPSKSAKDAAAESEGEDDLDALLAEQETRRNGPSAGATNKPRQDEDEEDDLDALLAEQDARAAPKPATVSRTRNTIFDDEEDDEDDLDALLAEQESRKEPALPAAPASPSKETAEAADSSKPAPQDADVEQTGDMLSSPLPNNPEEEDLADFLSSPIPNDE
jgi:replication fork protection complex subunit Csm3/Swi3